MSKFKFDWARFGRSLLDTAGASSAPIITGLGMIGLGLLAKKLNIPYQVFLDPGYSTRSARITRFPQNASPIVVMPNNSIEAAISAIYNGLSQESSDYYICEGARKIYNMLSNTDMVADDKTRTYAIMTLSNLSKITGSSYYANEITKMITKIATGDF